MCVCVRRGSGRFVLERKTVRQKDRKEKGKNNITSVNQRLMCGEWHLQHTCVCGCDGG